MVYHRQREDSKDERLQATKRGLKLKFDVDAKVAVLGPHAEGRASGTAEIREMLPPSLERLNGL